MLTDLTLVVPTYDRHRHLSRLLKYYAGQEGAPAVLVLDSSRTEVVAENVALMASLGPRFRHVRCDGSTDLTTKLSRHLALVDQPYCAICADDDLVFVDGLAQALAFLRDHPDYCCVDGIYLGFSPTGGEIRLRVEYCGRGIDLEHSAARMFRLLQRYESMYFAVYRSADLRDIVTGAGEQPTMVFQELFQAIATLIKGKSRRLPLFYAGRQDCAPAETVRGKWNTFEWFAESPAEVLEQYQAYRDRLWRFYDRHGRPKMAKSEFERASDLAHVTYFGSGIPPDYFPSVLQPVWPRDVFVAMRELGTLIDDLQAPPGLWHRLLRRGARTLSQMAVPGVLPFARRSLRRESARLPAGAGWRFSLPLELRWLADVPGFRAAFLELCRYLGTAPTE